MDHYRSLGLACCHVSDRANEEIAEALPAVRILGGMCLVKGFEIDCDILADLAQFFCYVVHTLEVLSPINLFDSGTGIFSVILLSSI